MNYVAGYVMSSRLISISEDRDVEMAESLMKINKIRHLPVVNFKDELSGIISAKDIAQVKDKKKPVKSVMTAQVRIVKKTDSVKSVIELMLRYKISSALVTNEEDIVGIVTTDDLLNLLSKVIDDNENIEKMDVVSSFFDESWHRPV